MDGDRSGLACVVAPIADSIEQFRQRHDPLAALGVPPHVTVLFPFVPPPLIDDAVLDVVAEVISGFEVFDVTFADIGEFPGVVWLRPSPDQHLRQLTDSLAAAFPAYPPYEGEFPDPQPHLTIGNHLDDVSQSDLRRQLALVASPLLPFTAQITTVSLLVRDLDGGWAERAQFPMLRNS